MEAINYLYDAQYVRYRLVKSNSGPAYNWLFVPGGPGVDSSCFLPLVQALNIPGNIWLIDLPANGSNISEHVQADYDFERWADCFLSAIKKFQNPIYVGHSFGGMFPLLFPQLESILKGFVILNSAPSLWLEEAAKLAQKNNLPVLTESMNQFEANPNQSTFKQALLACLPYYFPPNSMEIGRTFLEDTTVNYHAAVWWLRKANEINFTAKWVPQNVPTLIVGATHDYITPVSLFKKDERFNRENILLKIIQNAGHFPWFEQMEKIQAAFDGFLKRCPSFC